VIPGTGTTFQEMCDHAGAINLAGTLGGLRGHSAPPVEQMLGWPVDRVVLTGKSVEDALAPFREMPPYSSMEAVKSGRAVLLPAYQLSCVSFHRIEGWETLARALHPEAFR
jgi:iron complex transport system substrate-binding protein